MDYVKIVREEIALEGLEGITISALWMRLDNCQPAFPLALDDPAKQYLWEIVVASDEIDFYELPCPRLHLVITDRFKNASAETGICEEMVEPNDIYPIKIIKDGDVVGSCSTYYTRKKISQHIRDDELKPLTSLNEVIERWGEKLVMVASQQFRSATLYGEEVDPSVYFPEKHYCVLERIGRSRWQGEVTQGARSLQVFKEPSKNLFYIRKVLFRYNLITIQAFNQKLRKGNNVIGKLIHLRRFFTERKPAYQGWLEILTSKLAGKPGQREVLPIIRGEMGLPEKTFKKLYQLGSQYVKTEVVPYRDIYPDAGEDEYMVKQKNKERFLRVVSLIKQYKFAVDMYDEMDGPKEDEDEDDDTDDAPPVKRERWGRVREIPMLHQTYAFILQHKEKGCTQNEVCQAFGIGKLDSRLLCRNLERLKVVKRILQDAGRQRVQVYVANEWVSGSKLHKQLQEEKDKIRRHLVTSMASSMMDTEESGDDTLQATIGGAESSMDISKDTTQKIVDQLDEEETRKERSNQKKKQAHVTYWHLRRANMVLEAVKEAKLIDNIYHIQKKIIDEEQLEGKKGRLDKKSLLRIIEKLAGDGQIKSIKTLIKFGSEQKELHFLCDPNIATDAQIVKSAIEAAKMRHLALSKELTCEVKSKAKLSPQDGLELHSMGTRLNTDPSRPNYALLKSQMKIEDMMYDADAGRKYGYVPRMKRCQLVHELLWYLTYMYNEQTNTSESMLEMSEPPPEASSVGAVIDEARTASREAAASTSSKVESDLDSVVVYKQESTWRRFIPPLPHHSGYRAGWCLIGDVLLNIPISMFCQIIRVNFKITGLEEYLAHPVKRYLTISQLPTLMRQQLTYERKFLYTFYEICTCLCQMGLLSFGKREWKEKEQIFIFIHKRCSVIDTSNLDIPLEERPVKHFTLNTYKDFHEYWFTLQCVCLNTPLDVMNQVASDDDSKDRSLSKTMHRPARFVDCLQGKSIEEMQDSGEIPGNHLGAAGLDSMFWAHLKRNWSYNSDVDVKVESLLQRKRKREGEDTKRKKARIGGKTSPKRQHVQPSNSDIIVPLVPRTHKASSRSSGGVQRKKAPPKKMADTKKMKGAIILKPKAVSDSDKATRPKLGKRKKLPPVPGTRRKRLTSRSSYQEKKKKRVIAYDDVDKAALRRMTKERVAWTPQEDSLLLLCQVASVFLGGHRRDFLVPFSCIRDIMHANFHTALDKTSKACQRRLRYILKNSQTVTNVNMYLGEVLQDKTIVDEFKKGKRYVRSQVQENVEVFKRLLEKLRIKFTSSNIGPCVKLPDTVDDVYKSYTVSMQQGPPVSQHCDPQTEKDIQFSVLHNLIHAAMLLQDKTSHAHELYQLFSQYPEDLLLAVFTSMKNDGIVTKVKRKYGQSAERSNTVPSVAMGTYQMAQRYTYNWFTRYPRSIFLNTYLHLCKLGGGPVRGGSNDKVPGLSSLPEVPKKLEMEDSGGFVAMVIGLMAQKKITFETVIPEKIIVVESSFKDKETAKQRKEKKRVAKELHLGTQSDEEEEALIEEAEKLREAEKEKALGEAASKSTSGGAQGILTALSTGQDVKISSRAEKVTTTPTACRINLSLVRGQYSSQYATAPISVRILAPQDNLAINSCRVNIRLNSRYLYQHRPPSQHQWKTNWNANHTISAYNAVNTWIHASTCHQILSEIRVLQPVKVHLNEFWTKVAPCIWRFSQGDIRVMRDIYEVIRGQGILGSTLYELLDLYEDVPLLQKYLAALVEHRL